MREISSELPSDDEEFVAWFEESTRRAPGDISLALAEFESVRQLRQTVKMLRPLMETIESRSIRSNLRVIRMRGLQTILEFKSLERKLLRAEQRLSREVLDLTGSFQR